MAGKAQEHILLTNTSYSYSGIRLVAGIAPSGKGRLVAGGGGGDASLAEKAPSCREGTGGGGARSRQENTWHAGMCGPVYNMLLAWRASDGRVALAAKMRLGGKALSLGGREAARIGLSS